MSKKPFLFSGKMLVLLPLVFAGIFAGMFLLNKNSALDEFALLMQTLPSIRDFGTGTALKMQDIWTKYGMFVGVGVALIGMLFSLIALLILKIVRLGKFYFAVPLAILFGFLPFILFGHNMVFVSSQNTAISASIILFLGYPLWKTGVIFGVILLLLILFSILRKQKKLLNVMILCACLSTLSGCDWLNALTMISCELNPDSAHCFQEGAVGSGETQDCEKIPQKPEFQSAGSNPPKDKCYLMIASNKGDPSLCDGVQGGMMSYSKEECIEGAMKNNSPDVCKDSKNEAECRNLYGQKTGNCGEGYVLNTETKACEKGSGDSECADPSFTSKCASSHSVLICENGKKRIENCQFGCFEATCRATAGQTDIVEPEKQPEEEISKNPETKEEDKTTPEEKEEEKEEEKKCDCAENEICQKEKCVPNPDYCGGDGDCKDDQKCLNKICVQKEAECVFAEDCQKGFVCQNKKCVVAPACKEGDKICVSSQILEYCAEGKITKKECSFGCDDAKCLTQEEKETRDKEKAEELACKAGYKKCLSDVTLVVCEAGAKTEEMCEFGCKSGACRTEPKKKCTGLQRLNPFCEEDDEDIEDKLEGDLDTIKDAVGGKYMELLDDAIENEKDPAKLLGLEKYKEFLEKAGEGMEEVQTSIESLKELKRIFIDAYDPSMNVENMPVDKILKKGLFDKISDSIFGEPTTEAGKEMAEAEDSLAVYEKMLERQQEIDFLMKSRMGRLGEVLTSKAKDEMVGELKDKAEEIAKGIAGDAMIAVGVVDYALTSFQDEAKKQMFVGLARAYNRRRADLEAQFPDMDNEAIHSMAVNQIQDMPYEDAKGTTFVKYGNLIENKDCQDSSNPLCLDNRVWWTAMEKTYEHSHRDDLNKRFHDQFDRRLEKSKN